jgi:hypothetical protein
MYFSSVNVIEGLLADRPGGVRDVAYSRIRVLLSTGHPDSRGCERPPSGVAAGMLQPTEQGVASETSAVSTEFPDRFSPQPSPKSAAAQGGYRLSSDELFRGLDVRALRMNELPDDIARELLRLRKAWGTDGSAGA